MKLNFIAWFVLIILSSCTSSAPQMDNKHQIFRTPTNFQDCFKVMENFIEGPTFTSQGFVQSEIKLLSELENSYGNHSFIDIQKTLSNEKIRESNTKTLNLLEASLETDTPEGYTNFLTKEELDLIYRELAQDKVHLNHSCFDPKGTIGFCFGRATIVHMEALIRGVNPDAIRKIWIVGDMQQWGHHVATMIKGEKGWYVIDTNNGMPILAKDWLNFYQPFKNKNAKDIMVFVSRADRFGPYDNQSYTGINLFNSNTSQYERTADFYRGYFHEYFEALDKERKEVKKFPARK